ncbi:MAG: tyrosine-type recombinase/integrase [Chitinophagales bacterium]|nr:tyrosine-type recombinase/integrase [Chitinophagales bacterium]
MRKLKHRPAVAKPNNTSIVIYYSYQGKEMRYPTGVSIDPQKDKDGKFTSWDYKNNRLKLPTYNGKKPMLINTLETKQQRIDDLLNRANSLINRSFSNGSVMYPNYLESLLSHKETVQLDRDNTSFFDYFNQFLERKREHFNARGKIISLKDYNSTLLLLQDFEKYKNIDIRIEYINNLWLEDFVNYMATKHPKYYGDYKVHSQGEMKDSTKKKRLDILAEFFTYLKELKVVSIEQEETVRKFKKRIKKQQVQKATLDIPEIHKLYKFKFAQRHHEQIRDLFVFLCLTGIRFQDLIEFDKNFIKKSKTGSGYVYVKAASKTSLDYNIPLCQIVLEILNKYKFELPKITGQYGNRAIKEALQITGLFDDITQNKHKYTKENKRRFEAITLHKGRDSFITNLVDTTPLNELMKYTGHKKLSTLQGYIDKKRPVKMDYIKVFDMKKRIPKP